MSDLARRTTRDGQSGHGPIDRARRVRVYPPGPKTAGPAHFYVQLQDNIYCYSQNHLFANGLLDG